MTDPTNTPPTVGQPPVAEGEISRDDVIRCASDVWAQRTGGRTWDDANSGEQELYMGFARQALAAGYRLAQARSAPSGGPDVE